MLRLRGRSLLRHGLLFVALRRLFPGLRHAAQTAEELGELGNGHANLVGGIALANGDGVWVAGLPQTATIITVGQGFVTSGALVDAVPESDVETAVAIKAGDEAPKP